jgi:hypothetical protein
MLRQKFPMVLSHISDYKSNIPFGVGETKLLNRGCGLSVDHDCDFVPPEGVQNSAVFRKPSNGIIKPLLCVVLSEVYTI